MLGQQGVHLIWWRGCGRCRSWESSLSPGLCPRFETLADGGLEMLVVAAMSDGCF